MTKIGRITAIVVVSLVLLAGAIGYFAIPAAARWGIETVAARELGRTIRVESISANPYTLRATINGLTVAGLPGETSPLLTVRQATVNASIASALRLAPVIEAILIDGLDANLVRLEAQRFNFDDIVERLRSKPKSDGEPARFALQNIEVLNSSIRLDDRVGARKHAVTDIAIGIPFISNLPVDAEVKVLPAFSARINGSPLVLGGETRPFHETLESSIQLKLSGLDIASYLPFSPVRLNFEVQRGTLDTDLRIAFRRATAASTEQPARAAQTLISGSIAVNDFALAEKDPTARLFSFKALRVSLEELEPLARRAVVGDVRLDGPDVLVVRGGDGVINWARFARQALGPAPAARAETAAPEKPITPFAFELKHAAIGNGRVEIADQGVRFEQNLLNLNAEARGISNASNSRGVVRLAADGQDNGSASLEGELGIAPVSARLKYVARDVKLRVAARYLANLLDATVDGSSNIDGVLEVVSNESGMQVALRETTIAGTGISVRGPAAGGAALDIASFSLEGGDVDLSRRAMSFAKASFDTPRVVVRRLPDGTINWAAIRRPAGEGTAPADGGSTPSAAPPWRFALNEVRLARGEVRFEDRAIEPVVNLRAGAIDGTVRNIVGDGSQRAELALGTRLGSGGTLAVNGGVRWDSPKADLRIDARNLDVVALRPYVAARLNGDVSSAELSARGVLLLARPNADSAMRLSYNGNVRLANLHVLDAASNDLLRWQVLDFEKLALKTGDAAPVVDLGKMTLSDFFARIIVSDQGRLNLLDIVRREPGAASKDTAPPAPSEATAPRPTIRIAGIDVARGNVNFTDNFVKPNFSANMTGVSGTVGALASDNVETASLALTGKIDDEAPLQIAGRLNPLAPSVFLDIEGSTKGVDLPRLTSYSVKYAGYPIVKGKLSMDVKYKIEDQKLAASNRLFLDQLTFGERVDSPTATKLPVLLAVSLLKNSRGEIDISLPISGSLNDPEFSIGGIIVQVIVNVLTRIVTAPFTLLAAAFGGGGEELGYIEFAGGSAVVTAAQSERLRTLAKALNDRPALRLDIIGRVEPAADNDGIVREKYDARLKAAKVRQIVRAGGESVDAAKILVTEAERPALVAAVYADEKIPDKPRNLIGMAKSLPAAEMEALIRANLAATPEDMRALANQRASAVRNALESEGKVSRERLFLVEPRLNADGINDKGAKTRVDFALK